MWVNVGSGDLRAPHPWVNVDSQPDVHPDIVASGERLPFADRSVCRVYCGHLLEHLDEKYDVPLFLAELRRVLRDDGRACFVGPDIDRAEDPSLKSAIINGGNRWAGDLHLWTSSARHALRLIGRVWPDAREVGLYDAVGFGFPVAYPHADWQFAICA